MQRAGYTCQGVTMRLYRNSDLGIACHKTCCAETDAEDAALVCFRLGIAFEELDYSALFRYRVIERFAAAYEAGLTPNPCVDCNRFMKFDTLLEHALSEGCDKLATGHYARVGYCAESGRWELRKAVDESKDQSYVLYMLTQRQLAHLALPLGGYHKDEIRKIACEQGFVTATKRESQDICFVPDGDYAAFLERWRGKPFPDGALLDQALSGRRAAGRFGAGDRAPARRSPLYGRTAARARIRCGRAAVCRGKGYEAKYRDARAGERAVSQHAAGGGDELAFDRRACRADPRDGAYPLSPERARGHGLATARRQGARPF